MAVVEKQEPTSMAVVEKQEPTSMAVVVEKQEPTSMAVVVEAPKTDLKRSRDEAFPGPHDQESQKKRKNRPLDLDADRLLLCTCQNKLLLMDAMKDMKFMLKRTFPIQFSEEETKAIEAEITEGKNTRTVEERKAFVEMNQFSIVHNKQVPMGCALIRCEEKQNRSPSEICRKLLDRIAAKEERSKTLGRLLPIDAMCKPNLEAFKLLAEKTIKPWFEANKAENKSKTWSLSFKSRGIKTLTKDSVLAVIDQWSDGHKVSLEHPDTCISVEVNHMFCGVALLEGWEKYHKYNVQSVQHPEAAEKERKRQQDQQKAKSGEAAAAGKEESALAAAVAEKKDVEKKVVATEETVAKKEETTTTVEEPKKTEE